MPPEAPQTGEESLRAAANLFAERFPTKPPEDDDDKRPVEAEEPELDARGAPEADADVDESTDDDSEDDGDAKREVDPKAEKLEAIEPPPSLSKEEKELFKSLPPDAQKMIARREQDVERHLRTKSGELAETQRQIQAKGEEIVAGITKRYESLDGAIATVKALIGREPDWVSLARNLTPEEYNEKRAAWDAVQATIANSEKERDALKADAVKQHKERQQKFVDVHHERLLEIRPELRDPKAFDKTWSELDPYLASKGLPPDVRSNLVDSRLWDIALDALAYRKLQDAKAKVRKDVKPAPKVTRPGTAPVKGDRNKARQGETLARLRKNPSSLNAAADAFGARFGK